VSYIYRTKKKLEGGTAVLLGRLFGVKYCAVLSALIHTTGETGRVAGAVQFIRNKFILFAFHGRQTRAETRLGDGSEGGGALVVQKNNN
jgi:hypothetical protein